MEWWSVGVLECWSGMGFRRGHSFSFGGVEGARTRTRGEGGKKGMLWLRLARLSGIT
jgi:hypothetical protein